MPGLSFAAESVGSCGTARTAGRTGFENQLGAGTIDKGIEALAIRENLHPPIFYRSDLRKVGLRDGHHELDAVQRIGLTKRFAIADQLPNLCAAAGNHAIERQEETGPLQIQLSNVCAGLGCQQLGLGLGDLWPQCDQAGYGFIRINQSVVAHGGITLCLLEQ